MDPEAPERVVAEAFDALGHLDVLVVNHAHSSSMASASSTAEELDRALAVNVRATLLLVQAFHARHDGRPGGRIVLMTSGQHRGPMPGELPYIAGKGALHQLTPSLAAAVAPKRHHGQLRRPGRHRHRLGRTRRRCRGCSSASRSAAGASPTTRPG